MKANERAVTVDKDSTIVVQTPVTKNVFNLSSRKWCFNWLESRLDYVHGITTAMGLLRAYNSSTFTFVNMHAETPRLVLSN